MKILTSGCGCAPLAVDRLRRRFWMRLLLPRHRAYRCRHCERGFLASKRVIEASLAAQREERFRHLLRPSTTMAPPS